MFDAPTEAERLIDDLIQSWTPYPNLLKHLIKAVLKDREKYKLEVADILAKGGPDIRKNYEKARAAIVLSAIEQVEEFFFRLDQFVLHKKQSSVESILGPLLEPKRDAPIPKVEIPSWEKMLQILVRCIFPDGKRTVNVDDLISFLFLTMQGNMSQHYSDNVRRYKSMLWYICLCEVVITVDGPSICRKECTPSDFAGKIKSLLEAASKEEISGVEHNDPEKGKWKDTLFDYLQGEKAFLKKLREQLDPGSATGHGNRYLQTQHRKCILRQAKELFCN